jgi:two-component system phosphate regulon sensor histidine kinase PhoR
MWRVGGAMAVLAAAPLACFVLLGLAGAIAPGPALLAASVCVLASGAIAWIWRGDIVRLKRVLRAPAGDVAGHWPVIPSLGRIASDIQRLARGLAARVVEAETARRASEAIIERLPDPLLLLDADRSRSRSNAAARAAFGTEMAAVLRHPGLRAAIDLAFASGAAQTADLALPVPVAREVQATVILLDPRLPDGTAALVVLSDRTRERAVERTRSDFVTNASHELRTPLASLIGFIETLRGPAADDVPAQRRFLGIMAQQGARMHRLIDDLLSLSRIELSEHLPPGERVDVVALVRSVAAGFEPRLAERKVSLALDLQEGLPMVAGDADQLAQVLGNLIDNAMKYGGDAGEVRLSVALAEGVRWPARAGLVIAVADQGPGIARAHLPRLTERFYRVDKARSRGAGGTGLGLAIVKHIVNRHRGQLAIDSEEGHGSVFSVWLPVEVDATPPIPR